MTKEQGWDSPENEVQSNWVKFNVPMEDKIKGTLLSKTLVASKIPGQEGKKVWNYELKADEGTYHALDESKKVIDTPIEVVPGGFYSLGGTTTIDRQMKNVQVGQKIGLKYVEDQPNKTKGFNPTKIIKVYVLKDKDGAPLMDSEWLAKQSVEEYDSN